MINFERFLKRNKKEGAAHPITMVNPDFFKRKDRTLSFSEPITLAQLRLRGGAKDLGAERGIKMYNAHKTRLDNQWVSPSQSINSGYGTAQLAYYAYQNVNYWECFTLSQDPLMNKVFELLSKTPFSRGGEVLSDKNDFNREELDKKSNTFHLTEHLIKAVRSSFVAGGCLVYLDFGLDNLAEPLDLSKMDMRKFRGFRHIDPINVQAVDVNTINPAESDYMTPKSWYVIGLGVCHNSHFLHFEQNTPEMIMKPLCMYFGMPLTQLIKADVANSNLTSQGAANLINRFRYLYMKTDRNNFATNVENFRRQLEMMSTVQDNFMVTPLALEEDVFQLTTSLTGLRENVELFYSIVAAKTFIPMTELFGKSAEGMNATGEGDRKSWYDEVRRIQSSIKDNLLVMYGIIAGIETGHFVKFKDYIFAPLEELNKRETIEIFKGQVEVAKALIEMGAKTEDVFEWLKKDKDLNIGSIEIDAEVDGLTDYDGLVFSEGMEQTLFNAWEENKHKRDKDGKFTKSGSGKESSSSEASLDSFLGEEFTDVKGQAAVDKLMQEKKGYVKDAFTRKDIGDIALIWGNDDIGLQHIIKRRKETGQNLGKLLSSMTEVIEKGELHQDDKKDFVIRYKGKRIIVEPKLFNKKLQFVMTAYYEK